MRWFTRLPGRSIPRRQVAEAQLRRQKCQPLAEAEFVNTQISEIPVYAIVRSGGTLEQAQTLMVNGFPVVIEFGYEPPATSGWGTTCCSSAGTTP